MKITEHEGWTFLIGAAVGSIVTYYYLMREKRIIFNVRRDIDHLGNFHDLTPVQYRQTIYPNTIASDQRILELHRWAQQAKKSGVKLDPTRLAAEAIICEELLGLSSFDAVKALLAAKSLNNLRSLRPKVQTATLPPGPLH